MKRPFFLDAAFASVIIAGAQPKASEVNALNNDEYKFGKTKQGVPVSAEFILTNIPAAPRRNIPGHPSRRAENPK